MNFSPRKYGIELWDTWIYPDLKSGRYFLFYLANYPGGHWEYIGRAVSEDLLRWEELEPIHVRSPGDAYDVGVIGTGMVFKGPDTKYYMTYTANFDSNRQSIAFLESDNLIDWRKINPKPIIFADGIIYEIRCDNIVADRPVFRDAFIHEVEGHYEALIATQSVEGPGAARGVIARYKAKDCTFTNWEAMNPILGPGIAMLMEVPEYFSLNDRHYLLWSSLSSLGYRLFVPSRGYVGGTFYSVADKYEGPYRLPKENLLLGSSDKTIQSYVGRQLKWKNDCLIYHHLGFPKPALAFPKRIVQTDTGELECKYWPELERLHTREHLLCNYEFEIEEKVILGGLWKKNHRAISGHCAAGWTSMLFKAEFESLHLRCRLSINANSAAMNFLIGKKVFSFECDRRRNCWSFCEVQESWLPNHLVLESVYEKIKHKQSIVIDILIRDGFLEAYVDGYWKMTRVLGYCNEKIKPGFAVEDGQAGFDEIYIWEFEAK